MGYFIGVPRTFAELALYATLRAVLTAAIVIEELIAPIVHRGRR